MVKNNYHEENNQEREREREREREENSNFDHGTCSSYGRLRFTNWFRLLDELNT